MTYKGNNELLAELRKLLPGLPDNLTELTLTIAVHSAPTLTCKMIMKEFGAFTEDCKQFNIVERKP